MTHLKLKGLLLTLATLGVTLSAAPTPVNAKTIWSFGNNMKTVRTAPKAIRGNWYGYTMSLDDHASKLTIRKKYFIIAVPHKGKTVNHKVHYAKHWLNAPKAKNAPNIDLRSEPHGWYFFNLNAKPSWELNYPLFQSGFIQPVKYRHKIALAYYPLINEKKNKVLLLTKKKQKRPVYKSTKHLTIVNLYGGK